MNWFYLFIAFGCVIPLGIWGLAIESMAQIKNQALMALCIMGTGLFTGLITYSLMTFWDSVL